MNLTTKSLSLPKFLIEILPKFNLLKLDLKTSISGFSVSTRISIKVPPLKSTPKFRPLKKISKTEIITNANDIKLKTL